MTIKQRLILACKIVRNELQEKYDVKNPFSRYYRYSGLCDEASIMVKNRLLERYPFLTDVKIVHGEQRHTPRLRSSEWTGEHTWVSVKCNGTTYYVDPTASQFQDIYNDIPDIYVSTVKPKWYFPDDQNPVCQCSSDLATNILGFIEYDLLGKLFDFIGGIIS